MPAKMIAMKFEPLIEEGLNQQSQGNIEEAEQIYKSGISMAEAGDAIFLPWLAKLSYLLGDLHFDLKEYAQAEACYRKALAIYEGLPAADVIEISIVLRSLSGACQAQKKIRNAAKNSIRANGLIASTRQLLEDAFNRPSIEHPTFQ